MGRDLSEHRNETNLPWGKGKDVFKQTQLWNVPEEQGGQCGWSGGNMRQSEEEEMGACGAWPASRRSREPYMWYGSLI